MSRNGTPAGAGSLATADGAGSRARGLARGSGEPVGSSRRAARKGQGGGSGVIGVNGNNGFLAAAPASPSAIEVAETLYKTPALVSHRVRCGRPTCRCAADEGHGPYWFLHWREGGTQRRRYVRQADVAAVRAVVERRRRDDREARLARTLALADLRRLRAWLRELETA